MAKGRKLMTSRGKRLLRSHSQGLNGVEDSSKLGEEDVWSIVKLIWSYLFSKGQEKRA
jgi:hypothetical protein